MGRLKLVGAVVGAVVVMIGCAPSVAQGLYREYSDVVTSFDDTKLVVHFTPATRLALGETAPTVLVASPWSMPSLPGVTPSFEYLGDLGLPVLGPASLAQAGYNVVTWDNRGFGSSGGQVDVANPDISGRDVVAIVSWLASQHPVLLDSAGDPRVAILGTSYGAGISVAGTIQDHRIDASIPNMGWNSLIDSVYPQQVVKSGWGSILCGTGDLMAPFFDAIGSPAGPFPADRYSPGLRSICNVLNIGVAAPQDLAFGREASPGERVRSITTPTLVMSGTADTLFPLAGAVKNYQLLKRAATPVKMVWYCGGHGVCSWDKGTPGHVIDVQMQFLERYLRHEDVDTGPEFEWIDQTGVWHSAPSFPLPGIEQQTVSTGHGRLGISPFNTSGLFIASGEAANAVNVEITDPASALQVTSSPVLRVTYVGTADRTHTPLFAQILDRSTGQVAGKQITPFQVVLDGQRHTVEVPLEMVSLAWSARHHLTLQITDASNLYYRQEASGSVNLEAIEVRLTGTSSN